MLRLELLGGFGLRAEQPLQLRNKKAQALLAFLALSGDHRAARDRVATLLWPDSPEEAARQSLRQCISVMRRDIPHLQLTADHDVVMLDVSTLAIDVREFESSIATSDAAALAEAINLYAGDLLDGVNARSDLYEAWIATERTRLRAAATAGLRRLIDMLLQSHAREQAEAMAHRSLALDPLQEDIHRSLIRMHVEGGQTALAIRQYKRCETVLRKELGIEPDAETKALYQDILRNRSRRPPVKSGQSDAPAAGSQPVKAPQSVQFCLASDGVRIAYAHVGKGPPLVKAANWLNHLEFDFESPVWRHWINAFSRDHLFLRYDERGNGLSDWNVFDISLEAFVRDLQTVVDAAGLTRFSLLGISQGCAISIAYAVRFPERVDKLILFGGYAKGWLHGGDPAEITRRNALGTLIKEGWGQENPVFRQIFTSLMIPGANAEQMDWFNDLQRITTSPENAFRLTNEFGKIDVRHLLAEVKVPTLILHSRGDARVKFTEGQELAAGIKGAKFVPLNSNNHLLLETEPAWGEFLAEVRAFLRA
jgi:DNA-binding SARP family transcriptional activator/pimeloyl-ACP methyl ester carboxylesterase